MKKISFVSAALAAMMLASCGGNTPEPEITPAPDFIAVIDNGATKTDLTIESGAYVIKWSEGDEILVKGSSQAVYKVKTAGSQRTDLVKVSGDAGSGPYTAVYPADLAEKQEMPSVIDYCEGVKPASPMAASSPNNILPFKSVFGMLTLNLTSGQPINVAKLVMKADRPLSGKYEIVNGAAVIKEGEGLTVECGEGMVLGDQAVTIGIEVPEGRYSGISFSAVDADGREFVGSLGDRPLIVERSKICSYDLRFGDLKHLTTTLIDGPALNMRLKTLSNNKQIDSVTFQDRKVKKIVFETGSTVAGGTELQTPGSDYKVFANYDSNEGIMTISTEASEIFTSKDVSAMFRNFQQLVEIANLPALNTSKAKTMDSMFCMDSTQVSKLAEMDLSGFDTSNVTDMDSMFFGCKYLVDLDLKAFNTSSVTSFRSFVSRCVRLESVDVSSFDVSAAEDLEYMFANCTKLTSLDLSSFVPSSARSLRYMFAYDNSLEAITFGKFTCGNAEDMDNMFRDCKNLLSLDLSSFDTGNVSTMRSLFNGCEKLKTLNVSSFDVTSVTHMSYMFYHCYAIESLDLSSFNLTVTSPNCDYFFCRMYNLKDLYLGSTFILTSSPSYYVLSSSDSFGVRTGNKPGAITIYCDEATAEFIATTNWRWINSGYSGQREIPVTFRHYETNEVFTVKWAAN